ncbi:hypothetical protein [Actinokineospora sp. NBRC 105648]|uniref:hypothetical protein n=1 Tax=Actinokineospora sp. NBRC 105648 TaxID=3032206 RepID=UPI00255692EC|nr:hypothetical protein [Actinokineospora sp. NBRC 105648]
MDHMRDLVDYTDQVIASLSEVPPLGNVNAIDGLDSTAYYVMEALRWLQVHQAKPTA